MLLANARKTKNVLNTILPLKICIRESYSVPSVPLLLHFPPPLASAVSISLMDSAEKIFDAVAAATDGKEEEEEEGIYTSGGGRTSFLMQGTL